LKDKKRSTDKPKSSNGWWMIVGAVVLFGGVAWFSLRVTDSSTPPQQAAVMPQVTVQTLSPSMFTGETRAAYQVAKDIPDVLQQLPCFCGCKESAGHASNYFCFADMHGAECTMCQNIALDAKKMHDAGLATDRIREAIRIKYEHGGE
jgi:Protein of unknown function with PCYCGC motif